MSFPIGWIGKSCCICPIFFGGLLDVAFSNEATVLCVTDGR